jgi:putative transcriptional regulator
MKPHHHPHDELLMEYAAGSLDESHSLMVATHLSFCPVCRETVRRMESFGGVLLEALEPVSVSGSAKDALLAGLDDVVEPRPAPRMAATPFSPLDAYLPGGLESADWRRLGRSMRYAPLHSAPNGADAQLIHVKAGRPTIRHSHQGSEWTLVLTGAFDDGIGCYHAGDAIHADGETDHNPTALPGEDCICLVVIDSPIRLTGPVGRLFNPLLAAGF